MDASSSRGRGRRRPLGGRGIALPVALAAVLLVGVVGWLSLTGRLAGLQYANVPVLHPYPPAGYFVNPYTGDPRDLVNAADAARVKADFLQDGQVELDAFGRGDPALLARSDTGRALTAVRNVMAQNTAQGLVERDEVHLESVVVGRLQDPNDASTRWAAHETGHGAIVFASRATGAVTSRQAIRFDNKFWLVQVNGRYLIADAQINTQPVT